MTGMSTPERPGNDGERLMVEVVEEMFRGSHSPTPEAVDAYAMEKSTGISEGKPTWRVRNLDADSGRVYDFYNQGIHLGMVEEEYGVGSTAFVVDEGSWKPLDSSPVRLGKAVIDVESRLT